MDEKPQTPHNKLTINLLNDIPVIAMMERSLLPWGIRNKNSEAVYYNNSTLDFLNIPKGFDYEGKRDDEFPCRWSVLVDEFAAHDRKAECNPSGAEVIATSYYDRSETLQPVYTPKFPIYSQEGDVLGTFFYVKKFSHLSIFDFFDRLTPSVITLTPPVDLFTERELEIIFYAIQRMPAKAIAPKLCLSHRTVENRLLRIYEKISVNSINGLIDYCHHVGLNNYVPKKLLREGVNFCW